MTENGAPSPTGPQTGRRDVTGVFAAGSLLGAVGVSSCCVLPLVLFSVGVSGAWIGTFTALAPYQPLFLLLAVACLLAGFVVLYRKPAACDADANCGTPRSRRMAKIGLWSAALLIAAAVALPRLAPLFLDA